MISSTEIVSFRPGISVLVMTSVLSTPLVSCSATEIRVKGAVLVGGSKCSRVLAFVTGKVSEVMRLRNSCTPLSPAIGSPVLPCSTTVVSSVMSSIGLVIALKIFSLFYTGTVTYNTLRPGPAILSATELFLPSGSGLIPVPIVNLLFGSGLVS